MADVRKNDPCPCGSGKKYKQCCYWKNYKLVEPEKTPTEFTRKDGIKSVIYMASIDSFPMHNENGLKPNIPPEQMIDLILDEIYKILQMEQVGATRDLIDLVIREMDIVPNFTYRQICERLDADGRFEHWVYNICSLKGTDPGDLMWEQLEREK